MKISITEPACAFYPTEVSFGADRGLGWATKQVTRPYQGTATNRIKVIERVALRPATPARPRRTERPLRLIDGGGASPADDRERVRGEIGKAWYVKYIIVEGFPIMSGLPPKAAKPDSFFH